MQPAMDINAAKNQRESFKSAVTSDDSFMTASEGLIAMEEMDHIEDYPLLECTAPSEGQALPSVNAGQSNVLHFGYEEGGIGRSWIAQEDNFSLLECTAPLQGQVLHAVNARQSNFQCSGCSRRGMSNALSDEEAQLSPVVSSGPPQRPTQTTGHVVDSMAGRIGLSVVYRLGPKRVADTPSYKYCWTI